MRRAPVYLLIDTSGSMHGEPITAVKNGLDLCISELRNDPESMEKAYVSIITFAEKAEVALPLTYVADIGVLPQLEAHGTTSLGAAINLLNDRMNTEIVKNSKETKGDYKAFVLILTDGKPTDEKVLLEAIKNINYKKISYLIVATTDKESKHLLTQITQKEENVLCLPTLNSERLKVFFKWVSQSVSESNSHGDDVKGGDVGELPPLPGDIIDDAGDLL